MILLYLIFSLHLHLVRSKFEKTYTQAPKVQEIE